MPDSYSIEIAHGETRIAVAGPDASWVAEQASERFRQLESEVASLPVREAATGEPNQGSHRSRGRQRVRARGAGRASKNTELDERLTKEVRGELERYVAARSGAWAQSQPAQAAIIATFLADTLDWPGVDHDDLYTAYTVMGWPLPGNIRSQLLNARQRAGFFRGVTDGKYELSHAGENFARHLSLDAAETE